jgi:mycothiol synthase
MIRNLCRSDFAAMCQVISRSKLKDSLTEGILLEKTFGAFDYVADLDIGDFESSELVGFACGCIFAKPVRTGIRLLIVDPSHREHGVGSNLLRELEERLCKTGPISFIQAAATPGNYFNPGVDPSDVSTTCFLEKWGYKVVDVAQNLVVECLPHRPYTSKLNALIKDNYEIRRVEKDDNRPLLTLVEQHFPQWLQEVQRALLNRPITVHFCTKDKAVVGFACSESNNVGTGVLGPAGLLRAHRGQGLGTIMLHRSVEDLRVLGFQECSLPWTRFDLSLFARREFALRSRHSFWIYRKDLKP